MNDIYNGDNNFTKFKCEITLTEGGVILKNYYATSLSDLEDQIHTEFPSGRVTSVIGG